MIDQSIESMTRARLRAEPWPAGNNGYHDCPICGERWRPYAGSLLPCHAACMWTDDGALALAMDPRADSLIARQLGVTMPIVRAGRARGDQLYEAQQMLAAGLEQL